MWAEGLKGFGPSSNKSVRGIQDLNPPKKDKPKSNWFYRLFHSFIR